MTEFLQNPDTIIEFNIQTNKIVQQWTSTQQFTFNTVPHSFSTSVPL